MPYEVINPAIIGGFNITYNTKTPSEAAKLFWRELSKIIVNEIPRSYFSLRDDDGKLYHFKVTEEKSNSNMADYMLSQVDNVSKVNADKLVRTYDELKKQAGGKKNDDDDSSSSSDSDKKRYRKYKHKSKKYSKYAQPIVYYRYVPSVYDDESVFVPVFAYPTMPHYIEVGFSTAFWG